VVSLSLVAVAVGSNGLLLGEVNRGVPPARAGVAVGVVGAGASVGQLVPGPLTQLAIDHAGWRATLELLGLLGLLALPLVRPLRRDAAKPQPAPPQPLGDAWRDARLRQLALSFGVCGFHVGFLSVHMPGVIARCGLPPSLAGTWIAVAGMGNIAGSLVMGTAMKRHDHARLLALSYALRAAAIAPLLVFAPGPMGMLVFAAAMGATHMATLPPTVQLVVRRCGVQRLGALFGVVMFVHQLGSFAGVWFGGWAAAATGSDRLMWTADIALALLAATLVHLGKERHSCVPAAA
jgi:predicted MFS family arabinose efflux permease